jgi:predicted acyl esterase
MKTVMRQAASFWWCARFATAMVVAAGCSSPVESDSPPDHASDGGSGGGGATSSTGVGAEDGGVLARDSRMNVPMRDGVRLDTRVVLPAGEGPWPILLLRTPYAASNEEIVVQTFSPFVEDGYALVIQSCRGTAGSEGELAFLVQEFDDGHDAVEWLAKQPWSDTKIGTIGASYEGFTALAAAVDTPRVRVVIADGAISRAFAGWPGARGVNWWGGFLWWNEALHGRDLAADPDYIDATTNARPLRSLDQAVLGHADAVWQAIAGELDGESAFWTARSLTDRMAGFCTPALHIEAAQEWDDDPRAAFQAARDFGCPEARDAQRFVLGNHLHAGVVYDPEADTPGAALLRKYLATYLKDAPTDLSSEPTVTYHLTNAGEWRTAPDWPAAAATEELFLSVPDGGDKGALSETAPLAETASSYVADPSDDPCSLAGVPSLAFESAALETPLDVVGEVEIVLHVMADAPDADVFAELDDVAQDATATLVHLSRLRLRYRASYAQPTLIEPGTEEVITLRLPTVAWRVAPGHHLALRLTGSECGYSENPNTGGAIADETETRAATVTILTGPSHPSRVRIPVAARPQK